jgi:hypothetical protein
MSIKYIQVGQAGTSQNLPSWVYIETNDTYATVTTAGYLSGAAHEYVNTFRNNMMALVTTKSSPGIGVIPVLYLLQLQNSNGVWSLIAPAVDVPIPFIVPGNIQAGLNGTAGKFISYPATVNTGNFIFQAVSNTGNTSTILRNDAMGQASVINIPDPANAIGQLLIGASATPFVSGNFPENSGTAGLMVDSGLSVASMSASITQLGQLYQTNVTLNTAAVIAAYATPQTLIAAVAGKVAIVHSATVYTASTGNTAFATGTAPIIQYGTTVHGAGTIAVGAGLVTGDIEASTSQVRTIGPAASAVYTGITDTAVTFSCATAYTAGTGTSITFTLVYELINATV